MWLLGVVVRRYIQGHRSRGGGGGGGGRGASAISTPIPFHTSLARL